MNKEGTQHGETQMCYQPQTRCNPRAALSNETPTAFAQQDPTVTPLAFFITAMVSAPGSIDKLMPRTCGSFEGVGSAFQTPRNLTWGQPWFCCPNQSLFCAPKVQSKTTRNAYRLPNVVLCTRVRQILKSKEVFRTRLCQISKQSKSFGHNCVKFQNN